jgi:hypothetical protein
MGNAQHRRNRNRRLRAGGEPTYDGVPDRVIYERDFWCCRMEVCLCPDGRPIDPATYHRKPPGGGPGNPWRASIDHVISLAAGGWDIAANKRAAHQRCNEAAHWPDGRAQEPAPPAGRAGLSFTIGGDQRLRAALEHYLAGE